MGMLSVEFRTPGPNLRQEPSPTRTPVRGSTTTPLLEEADVTLDKGTRLISPGAPKWVKIRCLRASHLCQEARG